MIKTATVLTFTKGGVVINGPALLGVGLGDEFVLKDDHLAAVEAAKVEAVREFVESLIKDSAVRSNVCISPNWIEGFERRYFQRIEQLKERGRSELEKEGWV